MDSIATWYYPNGQIKNKISYYKGILQGQRIDYYETGQTESIVKYVNGKKDSVGIFFYPNEQIDCIENCSVGKLQGISTSYFENGKLKSILKYEKGKLDSIASWYYQNGQISCIATYRSGTRQGIQTCYYEDGKIQSIVKYDKGKSDSIGTWYYQSGQISSCAKYIEDKKDSIAIWYWPNGNVRNRNKYNLGKEIDTSFSYFQNGQLFFVSYFAEGIKKRYYENGNLQLLAGYKNGKADGIRYYYGPDGKPQEGNDTIEFSDFKMKTIVTCKQGKPIGEVKVYENNKLTLLASMKNGYPDGKWRYFNETGKDTLIEYYHKGTFLKEKHKVE